MGMLAAENIVARIRGHKLPSCVNPEVLSDSHNKLWTEILLTTRNSFPLTMSDFFCQFFFE
jgi:hypothetical protein